jgi:hypothetical protein
MNITKVEIETIALQKQSISPVHMLAINDGSLGLIQVR